MALARHGHDGQLRTPVSHGESEVCGRAEALTVLALRATTLLLVGYLGMLV